MPYIIRTIDPTKALGHMTQEHAAATLQDVGALVPTIHPDALGPMRRMSDDGGTIGPLPDGTVIVVEAVDWLDLYAAIGASSDDFGGGGADAEPAILAAFNQVFGVCHSH